MYSATSLSIFWVEGGVVCTGVSSGSGSVLGSVTVVSFFGSEFCVFDSSVFFSVSFDGAVTSVSIFVVGVSLGFDSTVSFYVVIVSSDTEEEKVELSVGFSE